MKSILHKANSRATADHGWLKTFFSLSFAGYFEPERVRFGSLRVLNNHWIEDGTVLVSIRTI